jgi:hypothetical protein
MHHTNVHLFSRNRTRKITDVFIKDTNLIAYPEYCIISFLSTSLLMISFTKVFFFIVQGSYNPWFTIWYFTGYLQGWDSG